MKTFIVWNGCDGYITVEQAIQQGYNFSIGMLHHGRVSWPAFSAECVDINSLPVDEHGEPDFTGFYVTSDGGIYREIKCSD